MRPGGDSAESNRWNKLTKQLLRWVEPDRGAELRMHIEDAAAAGEPLGAGDAASVLQMAARAQASRAVAEFLFIVAGLPVALLCLLVYGTIYETHFAPWDLMEEVQSTDPAAATLRKTLDMAWLVLVPLWATTGWRAARSIYECRFRLPGLYVAGLVALLTQADLFIERTVWFARGSFEASDVDAVSPHSLALTSLVFVLPFAYMLFDMLERRGAEPAPDVRKPGFRPEHNRPEDNRPEDSERFDLIAVGSIIAPFLAIALGIFLSFALFLSLALVAPSFRMRHKVAAAAVTFAPLMAAALAWRDGGIDDPGIEALGLLGAFVAVWAWLAAVTLQPQRKTPALLVDNT